MKKNTIMISISSLSGSLALFFLYISVAPIVYIAKDYKIYELLVLSLPVVMIPVIITLCRFINISITADKKKIKKEINKNGSKKTS